jgi:2-dehydro-3-deoxyphosphogalactonate aldolase
MNLTDYTPPLVAILRGLKPAEAPAVGRALFDAGFRILEVPLNRPGALECILDLASVAPPDALVGGGTVTSPGEVDDVHAAGGRLVVAPNCDTAVIERARALGMWCAPGVATPTEAFSALRAGAHALKIFPAEVVGPAGVKAMASVLPPGTPLWPVGGITPQNLGMFVRAGAGGFGIGSQLFQPGMDVAEVTQRAQEFVAAWHQAHTL